MSPNWNGSSNRVVIFSLALDCGVLWFPFLTSFCDKCRLKGGLIAKHCEIRGAEPRTVSMNSLEASQLGTPEMMPIRTSAPRQWIAGTLH